MTIEVSTDAAEYQKLIEDLQQHQFELTQQNEELRRTQQELNRATEKYRNLWDQAPIGYILQSHGIDFRREFSCENPVGFRRQAAEGKGAGPFP